jgi:hypothetical protein
MRTVVSAALSLRSFHPVQISSIGIAYVLMTTRRKLSSDLNYRRWSDRANQGRCGGVTLDIDSLNVVWYRIQRREP